MKLIAPRPPTHAPGALRVESTDRIPEELVSEQIERLGTFSAVLACLWTFGLVMELVVVPLVLGEKPAGTDVGVEAFGLSVSAAMYFYLRRFPHCVETKTTIGLWYMVVNALGIATLNALAMGAAPPHGPQVSWNAVLILVFSMISPTTPLRMLCVSMVAASTDPLVTWIAYLRGLPALPPLLTLLHYLPNYICAAIAMVPSHVYQRFGRRLRAAQDLGSYRLIEQLGQGGMGEVWRARHRLLARSAAVKLVRPEVLGAANDTEARLILRRFEREARATAALSSPHTIQVFDFGLTKDGSFYYVMELLAGRNLESLVREFGPVPADRAVYLLRQMCHSLADAHARGLVHRDIKPANVFACRMGLEYDFVKVLDFGLVKFNGATSVRQTLLTQDHQTTGTPAYMAPEVILGGTEVDRRADVYALGCVLYFLLTGKLVFEADTPMKMLMQHVQAEPIPPSERTELEIPKELDDIVLACLQKDPNKRPQHAEEMFRIANACRTCEGWNQDLARRWWESHLPDLTGPLLVAEPDEEMSGAALTH